MEIVFYGELHNKAENAHKFYCVFEKNVKWFIAYGRCPAYGLRESLHIKEIDILKVNKQIASKQDTYLKTTPNQVIISMIKEHKFFSKVDIYDELFSIMKK